MELCAAKTYVPMWIGRICVPAQRYPPRRPPDPRLNSSPRPRLPVSSFNAGGFNPRPSGLGVFFSNTPPAERSAR